MYDTIVTRRQFLGKVDFVSNLQHTVHAGTIHEEEKSGPCLDLSHSLKTF